MSEMDFKSQGLPTMGATQIVGFTQALADSNSAYFKPVNESTSLSCGAYTTTSNTFSDVTNLSVSLFSNGRPMVLSLIPDGSTLTSLCYCYGGESFASLACKYQWVSGLSNVIGPISVGHNPGGVLGIHNVAYPLGSMTHFDLPAAGSTQTYKIQALSGNADVTFAFSYLKLRAIEL